MWLCPGEDLEWEVPGLTLVLKEGAGLEGQDMALADLPTHPFLALEACQSQAKQ